MMYKVMCDTCAYINDNGNIVSPTQSLLQSDKVYTSNLIPKTIRNKILSYDLCVDRISVYDNPFHVCRGDIYVNVNESLSVIEQRQLIDGLMNIGKDSSFAILFPVVIRNAPDDVHNSVLPDNLEKLYDNGNESAFIGVYARIPVDDKMSSYRNSDSIAKAINHNINSLGLKTVFTDGSVFDFDTSSRDYYLLLQKTSRFHSDRFSYEQLSNLIANGFSSEKMHPFCNAKISFISVCDKKGIVGSVSLENVQMAGKRISDIMNCIDQPVDLQLLLAQTKRNSFFVNGMSSNENTNRLKIFSDMKTVFPVYANTDVILSSTPHDLSVGWKYANSISVHLMAEEKKTFAKLHQHANDILADINDKLGCSDDNPIALSMSVGAKIKIDNCFAESILIQISDEDNFDITSKQCHECFKEAIFEYPELQNINVSDCQIRPLVVDVKSSQKLKPMSVIFNRDKLSETGHINSNLIPDVQSGLEDKEQQINF